MSTIPLSYSVQTNPGVISAGGSNFALTGLLLTNSWRIPIGTIMSAPSDLAVDNYFGATSNEAIEAGTYFNGYTNSSIKPGSLLMAQYPLAAVSGYLRGGNISGITLATLQGYSGTLSVAIDGGGPSSATINLSGAASFTAAAQLIETDLSITGTQAAALTACTISGTTLTVGGVTSGSIAVGDKIVGAGVTAGSFVVGFLTGTGGAGTYTLSQTQTEATSETMTAYNPAVIFDSISGAFVIFSGTTGANSSVAFATGALATDLLLTSATGAVTSAGAAAAVPATFMNGIIAQNTNWALFSTTFDPDGGSGYAQKLAFSAWTNSQNSAYGYVPWDNNVLNTESVPQTATLAYQVNVVDEYAGTAVVYESGNQHVAAFVLGAAASFNFEQEGGRTSFAFLEGSGVVASVTDLQTAVNLCGNPNGQSGFGNYCNFYGAFEDGVSEFQRGIVSGPFEWLDSYVIQIWLNRQFQADLRALQRSVGTIPYNTAGNTLIEAALSDTIVQAGAFGAYQAGVTLSASEIAAVNSYAPGLNIAATLQAQGWYLLVGTASASVRASRGSPPLMFFYVDGETVQYFQIGTVNVT